MASGTRFDGKIALVTGAGKGIKSESKHMLCILVCNLRFYVNLKLLELFK